MQQIIKIPIKIDYTKLSIQVKVYNLWGGRKIQRVHWYFYKVHYSIKVIWYFHVSSFNGKLFFSSNILKKITVFGSVGRWQHIYQWKFMNDPINLKYFHQYFIEIYDACKLVVYIFSKIYWLTDGYISTSCYSYFVLFKGKMKFAYVSINYFYVPSQNQYIWQIKLANMKNIDITKAGLMIFIPPLDESQGYIGILMSVRHTFGFRIIIKVPLNQIFSNFHTLWIIKYRLSLITVYFTFTVHELWPFFS